MKFIHKDLNRLAEMLAKSNYDFYASVVTPWHLINVEAYIAEIAQNKEVNGVIVLGKHPKSGYVLKKEDVVEIKNANIEVLYQDEIDFEKKQNSSKIKRIKPIHIISPLDYQFELGRSIQKKGRKQVYLIRTDEGLMEYYDDDFKKLTRQRDGLSTRPFIKEVMDKLILNSSMKNWDNSQTIDRYMMKKDVNGELKPQQNVVISVRNYLQYCGKPIQYEKEAYAIFVSFVWEEDKMWNMSEYENMLKMLQRVLQDKGIKLYVKTHPREKLLEKYDKWGIPIFSSEKLALETLLTNLEVKPVAMFGLDSTALINASMLGGCPSVSLKKMVTKDYTSEIMWVGLETFEKYFKGYVKFVDSEQEIYEILDTVK